MRMRPLYLVLVLLSLVSEARLQGQFGVGGADKGKAAAVVVGAVVVGAGVGIGVTYLILHNRGTTTGCVIEAAGKKTLTTEAKQSYSLAEGGHILTAGERYKLKGRRSGPSSAPTFTVDKILKDYGGCP